jgi:hypothetical protein
LSILEASDKGKTVIDFLSADFGVQETLDGIPTIHAERLATLMTLNFQQFEDVSLLAA